VALYNSGYITSPNYPDKYYMDAECRWSVHVQRRQAIRITLLDFELDVKRGGRCYDYLEVASGDRTFFRHRYDYLKIACDCYDYLEILSENQASFCDCYDDLRLLRLPRNRVRRSNVLPRLLQLPATATTTWRSRPETGRSSATATTTCDCYNNLRLLRLPATATTTCDCYDYLEVASGDRTFFRDRYDYLKIACDCYDDLQLLRRPATATTTWRSRPETGRSSATAATTRDCYDYVEVASGDRTFFRDCGALGRQIVDVDTSCSHVTVTFRTGQTSLTQRGFLLHFEGTASSRA